ncbi:MAG TPA: hypothetical protein VEO00_06440 [Actinomycetota bacterium]|nr:hypothetical protein [Actinomycetota bacterium]
MTATGGYTQDSGDTRLQDAASSLAGGGTGAGRTVSISGGTLSGVGTVDGDLVNEGTVQPGNSPGIFTVTGTYDQKGGTLPIEIAGVEAGTQYDSLSVSGAATLGGTLEISTDPD